MRAIKELESEIKKREAELGVLKNALATLRRVGTSAGAGAVAKSSTRKPMSAEAKRKLSVKMKRLWREKQKGSAAKKPAKAAKAANSAA